MENVTEDLGEETQWGKIIFEKIIHVCLFQGWDGYRGLQQFLPLPEERVRIYRDPQSCEFPLHHYIGLVQIF